MNGKLTGTPDFDRSPSSRQGHRGLRRSAAIDGCSTKSIFLTAFLYSGTLISACGSQSLPHV